MGLFHEDVKVVMNGMHKFSEAYNGKNEFMSVLAMIPTHFENFSVTVVNMISEGDHVATQLDATADGMEAKFGHFHKVEAEKITEFWIYDDSQKMAHTMKAV